MTTDRRSAIRLALLAAAGALVKSREARACGGPYHPRTLMLRSDQHDRATLQASFQRAQKAGKPVLVSIASDTAGQFPYASVAGLDLLYEARDVAGLARLAMYEITCLEPLHAGLGNRNEDRPSLLVGASERREMRPVGPVRLEIRRPSQPYGRQPSTRRQTEPEALKALFAETDRNANRYAALCRAALPPTELAALGKRLEKAVLSNQGNTARSFDRTRIPDRALWEPIIRGAAVVLARALRAKRPDERDSLLDHLAWAELCHREADPPAGAVWGTGPAEERLIDCGMGHVPLKSSYFIDAYRDVLKIK